MEDAILLQDLEDLAAAVGVHLRYAALEGEGGLCRIRGTHWLILNAALPVGARVRRIAQALARFPLEDVFIRPHVRELLESQAGESRGGARHDT